MKLKIDAYSFGQMVINGRSVLSDVILFPDGRMKQNWRRVTGHNLLLEDIPDLAGETLEQIVVGTGAYGRMTVSDKMIAYFDQLKVPVIILPTDKAVTEYNGLVDQGVRVAGCFHLTC